MIIVKLQGGLGNQMFQYAAGRALALKHKVPLFLDHSFLERNHISGNGFTARTYGLDVFNIAANRLNSNVIDKYFDLNPDGIMYNYTELPVSYDKNFNELPSSTYITGNWQSPRYFEKISSYIREEFTFKLYEFGEHYKSVLADILETNSVAVHVRRGDYVPQNGSPQIYSICDERYYLPAMDFISKRHSNTTFFVFSEDIEWAKEHLAATDFQLRFVQPDQNAGWQDMFLMSKCKHNIIANSTFSWWAAWLNSYSGKTTVASLNWFNIVPPGFNLNHLYPEDWMRM